MAYYRIALFIAISLICILLSNCSNKSLTRIPPSPSISLNLKEQSVFSDKAVKINDFILSPLHLNRIWTFATDDWSYELNLEDNSWSRLDKYFGNHANGLTSGMVVADEFNPSLLWIINQQTGLTQYNITTSKLVEFPDIMPTSIGFSETHIFIGTLSGLHRIDREEFNASKIDILAAFPVESITRHDGSTLIMNHSYYYDHVANTLEGSYSDLIEYQSKPVNGVVLKAVTDRIYIVKNNDTLNSFTYTKSPDNIIVGGDNIWIADDLRIWITRYSFKDNKFSNIPVGYDFRVDRAANDDSLIWFYNSEGIVAFDKNNNSAKRITADQTDRLDSIIVVDRYIIGNRLNSIVVFSKDHLLKSATDVLPLAREESKFTNYVNDQVVNFKGDFRSAYWKFEEVRNHFSDVKNSRIQNKIEELKRSLPPLLPYSFLETQELEKFCSDTLTDDYLKASYYLHAINMANYEGKLKEALNYDSKLAAKYPDFRTAGHKQMMEEVGKSLAALDVINASRVSEDEKLWQTGQEYYRLFFFTGPLTRSSIINMSYPFSILKRLLMNYPDSQYADDAEFLILHYRETAYTDKGDNSINYQAIAEYNALLNKYPDTEYSPAIYERIARLYYSAIPANVVDAGNNGFAEGNNGSDAGNGIDVTGNNVKGHSNSNNGSSNNGSSSNSKKPQLEELLKSGNSRINNLKLASLYTNRILTEHPQYAASNSIEELMADINAALAKANWNLSITAYKKYYEPEEPVIIEFKLTNTDNIAKPFSIPVDRTIPGFMVSIERYAWHRDIVEATIYLQPDFREYNRQVVDTIIQPGGSYTEQWDITSKARSSSDLPPGKFILPEGRYRISAKALEHGGAYTESNNIMASDYPESNSIWITVRRNQHIRPMQ